MRTYLVSVRDAILGRGPTAWLAAGASSKTVSESFSVGEATKLPAVKDAVRFIATRLAKLPMQVHDVARDGTMVEVPANEQNPEVVTVTRRWASHTTRMDGLIHFMRSVLLHGWGAALVKRSEQTGVGVERIINIDPVAIERMVEPDGERRYFLNGSQEIPRDDLIFLPFDPPLDGCTDVSPLAEPWPSIRAALAATYFSATYFTRGAEPTTAYSRSKGFGPANLQQLKKEAKAIWDLEDKMRAEGRRSFAIPPGWNRHSTGSNAADADLEGQRRFGVEEVARIYDLPPSLLKDLSRGTYSNYSQTRFAASEVIDTWCERVAAEISNIIWPAGTRVVTFDTSQAVRDPFNERMRGYETGIRAGVMSQNEARRREGWRESDQPGTDDLVRSNTGGQPQVMDAAETEEAVLAAAAAASAE